MAKRLIFKKEIPYDLYPGLQSGMKKPGKISIGFEELSRNSVFFRTEVNLHFYQTQFPKDFVYYILLLKGRCVISKRRDF